MNLSDHVEAVFCCLIKKKLFSFKKIKALIEDKCFSSACLYNK